MKIDLCMGIEYSDNIIHDSMWCCSRLPCSAVAVFQEGEKVHINGMRKFIRASVDGVAK